MKYKAVVEAFKLEEYYVNELWARGVNIRSKGNTVGTADQTRHFVELNYKGKLYIAEKDDYVIVHEKILWVIKPKDFNNMFKEYEPNAIGKTLNNSTVNQAIDQVKDIEVYGQGDTFRLLCKASSVNEGWMKSTKVCNVHGGCIVQVTTQQKNPDGSYAVAEALTFVPGNHIDIDVEPRVFKTIEKVEVDK